MNSLTFWDVIGRIIPEAFVFIWAFYSLTKTKFDLKKYLLASISMSIIMYVVKILPIHFGIHTVLIAIAYIFINIFICEIHIIKSILVTIGAIIIEFICEIIDLLIIKHIFKINTELLINDPILKFSYTFPTFILFICIIIGIKYLINRKFLKYIS